MRTRAWRWILLIILIAGGAGAALSGWNSSRQIAELDRQQRVVNEGIDRLVATLDAATTAQQARLSASSGQDPNLASTLIDQLRSDAEGLQAHVRSLEGSQTLRSVANAVAGLRDIDVRAVEHLRLGQDLMAVDLVSSDGRAAEEAIGLSLRNLRAAENDASATGRADAVDGMWSIVGGVAALWVLGLILLTPQSPSVAITKEPVSVSSAPRVLALSDAAPQDSSLAFDMDLQRAADVCTAIGRLASADDLPRLLQQAAAVLDASGVVVWMAAGEELFAAAAFGYPPQVLHKLGPINRAAVNATAAAWRSGQLQSVTGTGSERSALAAPLLGPERCVGVLAVEVNPGREGSSTTRAVTTLIAAQLAAALEGWPAASAAAPRQAPPLERAAEA